VILVGSRDAPSRSSIAGRKDDPLIPSGIRKLSKRLNELREIGSIDPDDDRAGMALILANEINATVDDVFGQETAEAKDFRIDKNWFTPSYGPTNWDVKAETFLRARDRAIAVVQAAIKRLEEKLADGVEDAGQRTLRAYEGLSLHSDIARAASELYRDGHYANAVEASVKALNGLVRLRSGLEIDGTSLVE
jgi:hypothetical protein